MRLLTCTRLQCISIEKNTRTNDERKSIPNERVGKILSQSFPRLHVYELSTNGTVVTMVVGRSRSIFPPTAVSVFHGNQARVARKPKDLPQRRTACTRGQTKGDKENSNPARLCYLLFVWKFLSEKRFVGCGFTSVIWGRENLGEWL